jgi:hypothetical protein
VIAADMATPALCYLPRGGGSPNTRGGRRVAAALPSPSPRPQGPDQQRVGERGPVGLELGDAFLVAVTPPRHGASYWGRPTAVTAAFRDHLPVVAVAVSAFRDHGPEVTRASWGGSAAAGWESTRRPGRQALGGGASGASHGSTDGSTWLKWHSPTGHGRSAAGQSRAAAGWRARVRPSTRRRGPMSWLPQTPTALARLSPGQRVRPMTRPGLHPVGGGQPG